MFKNLNTKSHVRSIGRWLQSTEKCKRAFDT